MNTLCYRVLVPNIFRCWIFPIDNIPLHKINSKWRSYGIWNFSCIDSSMALNLVRRVSCWASSHPLSSWLNNYVGRSEVVLILERVFFHNLIVCLASLLELIYWSFEQRWLAQIDGSHFHLQRRPWANSIFLCFVLNPRKESNIPSTEYRWIAPFSFKNYWLKLQENNARYF